MNPIYKFSITDGTQSYEPHPIFGGDLAKEYAIPSGEMFFRASLKGKLTFTGFDFTFIRDAALDTQFSLDVFISYDGGATWESYWEGTFWKTDCEFDLDDRKVSVTPDPRDVYKGILDEMDKEYDLIQLAPEIAQVKADKRPMIQVYVEGESTIGCFLSGMWWEQECEEEVEESTLLNTYHFAKGVVKKEVKIAGSITPSIDGYYAGDVTSTHDPYDCLGNNYSYVFRYRYTTGSGYVRGDWEVVRTSDNVVLWSYYASGQNPNLNPDQITMSPVSGTGASGTLTVALRDINTYGRMVLDKSIEGLTYFVPNEDMVDNNHNYHYVMPYSSYEVKAFARLTSIPTRWGIFQPRQYYEEPLDDKYYPIGRSAWGGVSLWLKQVYLENEAAYRTRFRIRDAFPLASAIKVLLGKMAPGVTHEPDPSYSEFLYGVNPITQIQQTLLITPKSNVITAGYDQPAQKAPITLRYITEMLRDCYRCFWWIDAQNRFRIEHVEYFRRGGSYTNPQVVGVDLTATIVTRNSKTWASAKSKFSYDKPEMASRYQFGWMDDVTELFEGYPIEIKSKFVRLDYIEQVDVSMFTSDIDYILLNPNAISQDGFVLMSAVGSLDPSVQYELPYYTAQLGVIYLQNGFVSFEFLQNYYKYDLPARNYSINGVDMVAIGVKRMKRQEVTFPAIHDPNLLQLVRTGIGNGEIEKISLNLSSRKASASLRFDLDEGAPRPVYSYFLEVNPSDYLFPVNGGALTLSVVGIVSEGDEEVSRTPLTAEELTFISTGDNVASRNGLVFTASDISQISQYETSQNWSISWTERPNASSTLVLAQQANLLGYPSWIETSLGAGTKFYITDVDEEQGWIEYTGPDIVYIGIDVNKTYLNQEVFDDPAMTQGDVVGTITSIGPFAPFSGLPDGAIRCEMIYSNGYTAFVDVALSPSREMSFDAEVCWVKPSSVDSTPIGYYISDKRYAPFRLVGSNNPARMELQYNSLYYSDGDEKRFVGTISKMRHKATITPTGATIYTYDWETGAPIDTSTYTYDESAYTPDQTLGFLGRKSSASAISTGTFRGGLGKVRVWGDAHFGNLIAYYIPCYYQSKFGFWEKVGGQFKAGNDTSNIFGFGEYWNTQGFFPNTRNSSTSPYFSDYRGEVTSRMFEIPTNCTEMRFNAGTVKSGTTYGLMFFDQNKVYKNYWNYNAADRVVSVPSGSKYVRMTMTRANIATCYIYDTINNSYIWKGINV